MRQEHLQAGFIYALTVALARHGCAGRHMVGDAQIWLRAHGYRSQARRLGTLLEPGADRS